MFIQPDIAFKPQVEHGAIKVIEAQGMNVIDMYDGQPTIRCASTDSL